MAKRRSMNRRWSRRSANNSAFLNDDTNVLEDDDGYWQYLNQTSSRPPSEVNITAATAVLDPDSNLIDSNASASQWEYLEKSSNKVSERNPGNTSKSSEKEGSNIETLSEDPIASDSVASAEVRKKRPRLRQPRNPKSKNFLVMNSSDSTVEINSSAPPQHSKSLQHSPSQVPTRPTSPQDSIASLESEKMKKRRPRFRKQTQKRLDKGTPPSDNSVVLASQESRKSTIRPRSTFLNRSPDKRESKSARGTQKNSEEGRADDTGSDGLVSQPRKIFGQIRKFKVSENPFVGILDETEEGNQTNVSSPNETHKSQSENNDSGNFLLQITSVDSGKQRLALTESKSFKKQREMNELSGSSISEELKISQVKSSGRSDEIMQQLRTEQSERIEQDGVTGDEEEDSDDYQSFEDVELNTSVRKTVIGTSIDNQDDSRRSKKERSSGGAGNTEETLQGSSSIEVQARNDTRTFRTSRPSHIEPNKSLVHPALVSEGTEDTENETIVPRNRSRSTRSLKFRSFRLEHPLSPTLSASMSQDMTHHERSHDHTRMDRRGKNRRSSRQTLTTLRPPKKKASPDSEEEEIINKNRGKLNHSAASKNSESRRRDQQQEINSNADVDGKAEEDNSRNERDILSDSSEKGGNMSEKQRKTNHLIISRNSHSEGQDKQQTMNSEEELDTETVSENESIFSPDKFNISGSKVHSALTKGLNSITENEKTSGKSRKKMNGVPEKTLEVENSTRPGPKSFKFSIRSPEISSIQSPTETAEVKKFSSDKGLDKSHGPGPSFPKSLLELSPNSQRQIKQSEDAKMSGEEEIQRRPGPKSFKKSQRSFLLTSRDSNTSKISIQIPESPQKPEPMDNETESLSESSSRKDTRRRTNLPLYELPAQDRSSSISVSESDHESAESSVSVHTRMPSKSVKSKKREIESEDEKDRPPIKKSLNTSPKSSAHSRHLISPHSIVTQVRRDNTMPTNCHMKPTLSMSSAVDGTLAQQKQLRHKKIDALIRHNKPESSQLPQTSNVPFNPVEFKKKLEESKKTLKRLRTKEDEAGRRRTEKKKEEIMTKKVTKGFKGLVKEKKPDKIVDRAFIVNGKVYKRPKLPRPKHWATNKFYKFLWKKMEPKFGEQYRVKSEKFVVELNEVMTIIMRRKKYDNYKEELKGLLKNMAELGIIETRHDFHGFCFDFLPYEFRIKVVPMLRAGNTHNIPFEPEKLMEPILE